MNPAIKSWRMRIGARGLQSLQLANGWLIDDPARSSNLPPDICFINEEQKLAVMRTRVQETSARRLDEHLPIGNQIAKTARHALYPELTS